MNCQDCSICLEKLDGKKTIFTLSCNHQLHYECFLRYSYKNNHMFIDCPLCREMNYNIKPAIKEPEQNLKELCFHGKRCRHKTKNGTRCKKPPSLLNCGYCSVHNKDILNKDNYDIMNQYIFYILQTHSLWYTKIHMVDFIKKIIIKNPHIKNIEELLAFSTRYKYYLKKNDLRHDIVPVLGIYKYYDLDSPDEDWVKRCVEDKIIHS